MDVPMLGKVEYKIAFDLYTEEVNNADINLSREKRFEKLLQNYLGVSGFRESEPNAIMYQRIEQYGSSCENCGKPYRTKMASFCAALEMKEINN